ncbi:LysE family translocator [Aureivirga sp. CE67]|uniref:LysE family translocator n=1 Tax=Aureivirga sp. CE67 TaxID=1788983 RepID=UPI0018C967B4|nr:LysE family translocator [Aureivirga sp. CE67]
MNIDLLFSFLTASILLTIMPGPDIIYVLIQSISNGKKYAISTAAGLVSGIIVHTTLIAFGVSALIKESEIIYTIIKFFGVFYLLYLAYKTYRASAVIDLNVKTNNNTSLLKLFRQGFIMNVLNPKVTIFFLALFPSFIDDSLGNVTVQIYVLGLVFMLQAFIIFSSMAVLADKLTSFLRENDKFQIILKWLQIIVLVGISVFIIYTDL